mgnify:CR=1 FL=1
MAESMSSSRIGNQCARAIVKPSMKPDRTSVHGTTVGVRILIAVASGVWLIAAGCGADTTSVDTKVAADADSEEQITTSPTSTLASTTTASTTTTADPSEELVVCSGTELPLSALQDLEPLEARPEIEEVVNEFLESDEGDFRPQAGWQVVTISDSEVYVIVLQTEQQVLEDAEARDLEVSFDQGFGDGIDDSIQFSAQSVKLSDETWRWVGSVSGEDCELEVVPPDVNRVKWVLDPSFPAPTADSTTLNLLATERECASGQPMDDRLLPPTVVEDDEAVLITMTATPPSGDAFTCPYNPAQLVAITLASPLGDRELLDGSTTAGRISDYVGQAFDLS